MSSSSKRTVWATLKPQLIPDPFPEVLYYTSLFFKRLELNVPPYTAAKTFSLPSDPGYTFDRFNCNSYWVTPKDSFSIAPHSPSGHLEKFTPLSQAAELMIHPDLDASQIISSSFLRYYVLFSTSKQELIIKKLTALKAIYSDFFTWSAQKGLPVPPKHSEYYARIDSLLLDYFESDPEFFL